MVFEVFCLWIGKVDKELVCIYKYVDEEFVYKVNDLVYVDNIVEKDFILFI